MFLMFFFYFFFLSFFFAAASLLAPGPPSVGQRPAGRPPHMSFVGHSRQGPGPNRARSSPLAAGVRRRQPAAIPGPAPRSDPSCRTKGEQRMSILGKNVFF